MNLNLIISAILWSAIILLFNLDWAMILVTAGLMALVCILQGILSTEKNLV